MAKRGGFPGGAMGMPGNMNNLMKQAQRMQRQIELQGDHKVKVKQALSDMGFSSDTIEIRESKKNNKRRR